MAPELSIAIVLHNSAATLGDCLRPLREPIAAGWAELIAVDNASPDESVNVLKAHLAQAELAASPENRGFAAGANLALARVHGRYWLLLNPDVVVSGDGLRSLVGWMDAHPAVGIASPNIEGPGGAPQTPGRALPSVSRTLLELTRVHRLLPSQLRARVLRGPYALARDQLDAGWVPGTAMIIRPEAARQVGLLNESLFMYGEDIEWCWRMRRAGWRIGVCSSVMFMHAPSSSARVSFGESEIERRIAGGTHRACQVMYGMRRARLLAGVTALALGLEAIAPGREGPHRRVMREMARRWWDLATAPNTVQRASTLGIPT